MKKTQITKRYEYPYQFQFELLNKEKINQASDAVIDLLRKEYKLTPLECAYILDCLLKSLQDTMGFYWVLGEQIENNAVWVV